MDQQEFNRLSRGKLNSFEEFWPLYVHEHLVKRNRQVHFVGTTLGLGCLFIAATTGMPCFLLAALLFGYGFAWIGHFFIEHNRPATWSHPFYSLAGDFRMYYLLLNGKMEQEIDRLSPMWSHPSV